MTILLRSLNWRILLIAVRYCFAGHMPIDKASEPLGTKRMARRLARWVSLILNLYFAEYLHLLTLTLYKKSVSVCKMYNRCLCKIYLCTNNRWYTRPYKVINRRFISLYSKADFSYAGYIISYLDFKNLNNDILNLLLLNGLENFQWKW